MRYFLEKARDWAMIVTFPIWFIPVGVVGVAVMLLQILWSNKAGTIIFILSGFMLILAWRGLDATLPTLPDWLWIPVTLPVFAVFILLYVVSESDNVLFKFTDSKGNLDPQLTALNMFIFTCLLFAVYVFVQRAT